MEEIAVRTAVIVSLHQMYMVGSIELSLCGRHAAVPAVTTKNAVNYQWSTTVRDYQRQKTIRPN